MRGRGGAGGSESAESGFPGPHEAGGLQVHSFTPTWPRTCASARPGFRSPSRGALRDRFLDLGPEERALGWSGNSSSRPGFPLTLSPVATLRTPGRSRLYLVAKVRKGKKKKKNLKKQPPAAGWTWRLGIGLSGDTPVILLKTPMQMLGAGH